MLTPVSEELVATYGRELVVESMRTALEGARREILAGLDYAPMNAMLLEQAREWLEALVAPTLRPVINATGVLIHTNLGRAPLCDAALEAVATTSRAYSTLEYDIVQGVRGSRSVHASRLLTRVTAAEAALVVNNNAAAVLLMLAALCKGREVIISRGQLVEIGGGFRIPDIMAESGAKLVEVGTTNRTHLQDYESAINENTGAILVAHHSNFKIVGFTSEPPLKELAELAHRHELPLLYDQGSGALLETDRYGLDHEPTVQEAIEAGADVVAFSGDKLLGGPQAGILVGREAWLGTLRKHPLARAVRPDKLCLAALQATLTHYLEGSAEKEIPVWRMMAQNRAALAEKAETWAETLRDNGLLVTVRDGFSTVGGGSLPGAMLPTTALAIDHPQVATVAERLRTQNEPPVITRIADGQLLVDPRTVLPGQEEALLAALKRHAVPPPGGN